MSVKKKKGTRAAVRPELKLFLEGIAEMIADKMRHEEENRQAGVDMETVTLRWNGPYGFGQLITDKELRTRWNVPGVYLHVTPAGQGETIYYVGKATGAPSLFKRQLEHYQHYICGAFDIPAEVRRSGTYWRLNLNEFGVAETITDREKLLELVEDGFEYASSFKIFLAEAPRERVGVIEKNLLYDLQPVGNTRGMKKQPTEEINIVHENARWATDEVREKIKASVHFA
jgi:hypothetical protein